MSAQAWMVLILVAGAALLLWRRLAPKAAGKSCGGCCGGECHPKNERD